MTLVPVVVRSYVFLSNTGVHALTIDRVNALIALSLVGLGFYMLGFATAIPVIGAFGLGWLFKSHS